MSKVDGAQSLLATDAVPAMAIPTNDTVYTRNPDVQGPMHAFGYSWLTDQLGEDALAKLDLPGYVGERGAGGMYAYEALNLVDGKRTVSDIRDWLTAEIGPVPLGYVADYLAALASVGAIRQ